MSSSKNNASNRAPQPLVEVFGFPVDNCSADATRHRNKSLCPFNNKVPSCTKDKASNPLGVCSIRDGDDVVITCPIRFRQHWLIVDDAASFFFKPGTKWTTLTEVRLKDKHGKSAGNIDVVLCAYDAQGMVTDFGALEIQAVYISGNVRDPFEHCMKAPRKHAEMDWTSESKYPTPDYLSSSRKRLAPQLIFKSGILNAWGKKTAVALNRGFFNTLPKLKEVEPGHADIAWFVYDLVRKKGESVFALTRRSVLYTRFDDSLERITRSEPGDMGQFLSVLQRKVSASLDSGSAPETEVIDAPF